MNDSVYQSQYQNYSQHFNSASAMQLAYYESSHPESHLHAEAYSSACTPQPWIPSHQRAPSYHDQSRGHVVAPRSDSQLYASEFADPGSNIELVAHNLNMQYPDYSPSSGYPIISLDPTHPEHPYQLHETAAGTSAPEPVYHASPHFASSPTQVNPEMTPDSFPVSWPTANSFQVSPLADTPVVRYSPYTVKSQRRTSRDVGGPDTPPSPLSLARSKYSSISPSPGPSTPAVGNVALQSELYANGPDSRVPSQEPAQTMRGQNDEVDPDRPYPCSSCRMAFARQHDLTRHSRVHSGETPYYCHGCRQGFRRSDARSRHWSKDATCLAMHQQLVEGTEEGRKLQKSLLRLGDKAGRVGTATFRVHKPLTGSMRGVNA